MSPASLRSRITFKHLTDELWVERRRDLVEEHDLGLHRQRPHDGHALLLTPRQPIRIVSGLVSQAEAGKKFKGLALRLVAPQTQDLARCKRHVVDDAAVRKEVERLEDDADLSSCGVDVVAGPRDVVALEPDRAGVDRLEQIEAAEQRRLAAPGRTDQRNDLVIGDVDRDAAQHRVVAIGLVDVLQP